jgi:hypothetical protein
MIVYVAAFVFNVVVVVDGVFGRTKNFITVFCGNWKMNSRSCQKCGKSMEKG